MSCRHDLANGTCTRCYPATGKITPGPEEDYEDNLDGPGAIPKTNEAVPATGAEAKPYVSSDQLAAQILSSEGDGPLSNLLHTLWTKAVGTPDYDKHEWHALSRVLFCMKYASKK
jgi:hypothetical protein